MGTIVVGIDGSAGSDTALRWALAEARLRSTRLTVINAYHAQQVTFGDLGMGAGAPAAAGFSIDDVERLRSAAEAEARNVIEGALSRAGDDAIAGLEIERQAVDGPAAQVLIESARGAELLVIGSRGRGGFLGLLLGSVSQQCAQHPPCPVVILPPPGGDNAVHE
jgi:nucleotide-binding universal stress UspA family protein